MTGKSMSEILDSIIRKPEELELKKRDKNEDETFSEDEKENEKENEAVEEDDN